MQTRMIGPQPAAILRSCFPDAIGLRNYRDTETGERYWISGPRRDGLDRLYGRSALVVEIDDDVREEYWTEIRKKPEQKSKAHT